MLYHLAQWLQADYSFLRLFNYLTVRSVLGILTALIFSFVFGPLLIERLYRFKFGQPIRDDGPASHLKKTGTPTMGGLLILAAITVATLLWANLTSKFVWFALLVTLAFGAVGFADDYIKIKHKNPKGLIARKKYFWLSLTGFSVSLAIYLTAKTPVETSLIVPFLKDVSIPLGMFFVVWTYLVIVGSSNAVNLTDGLDGLAIMGGVFVAETVSVALQVGYFKYSGGKRIFRMAPLHHHYELKGWAEPKIIVRFWIITLILVLIGLSTLKIR